MKRLIWLILFSYCIALGEVKPVLPLTAAAEACCCCAGTTKDACARTNSKDTAGCVVCFACVPAPSTLLPATDVAVAASPAEISRLNCVDEKGRCLTYPPLLTPPRLPG